MRPIRIAISGKMRSGKDTVAGHLVTKHGFVRMSFADKLKKVAEDLFGVEENVKNRALLQTLGRRMCQVDEAVWLKYVIDRIPLYRSVVIPDLRFPNEFYALKGLGFGLVRIGIDAKTQLKRLRATELGSGDPDPSALEDASETALDGDFNWDLALDGAEDALVLFKKMDVFVERLSLAGYGR